MPDAPKLLLIGYHFPPVKVVSAIRLFHFYRESLKYFREVLVLTTSNQRLAQQDESLQLVGVRRWELPTFDLRRLTLRKAAGKPLYLPYSMRTRPWVRFLSKLTDSFPFNLIWGDGGLVYILAGYRLGVRLVQEEGITHVFSSYRPYSDHAIAWLLKRRFPRLSWVADFRDLHVDPVLHNVFFPKIQTWCNRSLLSRAELLLTVSEGLAVHLRKLHQEVWVIPNGLDPNATDPALEPGEHFTQFTISYTGSLFHQRRDPRLLFRVVKKLLEERLIQEAEIRICYAGPDAARWSQWMEAEGLGNINQILGVLPRQEALRLQRSSHLNLLLTYSTPELHGNLTGKFFEYLAARRPMLALIQGVREPELERIMAETRAGCVAYQDDVGLEQIYRFLFPLIREWRQTGRVADAVQAEALYAYRWDGMMEKLMNRIFA